MQGGEFAKLIGDILTSYIAVAGAIIGVGVWANKKSISKITQVVEETITDTFEEVYARISAVEQEVQEVKQEQQKQDQINEKYAKLIAYNHLVNMVKHYEKDKENNNIPTSYDLMNLSQAINEYFNAGNGGKLGRNAKAYLEEMQQEIDKRANMCYNKNVQKQRTQKN